MRVPSNSFSTPHLSTICHSRMVGACFHHQNELFYCSHWNRKIEKCFVDSLLEHHRNGTFHRDRTNCYAVLCSIFDINAVFGSELFYSYGQRRLTKMKICFKVFWWITKLTVVEWDAARNVISANDYIWEQINKARKIGKTYVNAPEPHWNALLILFGDDWSDETLEDETEFFDRDGTCKDDAWVHDIPPYESNSDSYEPSISHDGSNGDPSWCAFMQEYYAADSDSISVNMPTNHIRRPPPDLYQSPLTIGSQKFTATPSSCASSDPKGNEADLSPSSKRPVHGTTPKKPLIEVLVWSCK